MPERSRLTTRSPGIAVALVLSLIIAVSTFLIWQQYIRQSESTRATTGAILTLKELVTDLLDAESSARGFLLSRDEATLRRFMKASAEVEKKRDQLSNARAGFAGQETLLASLQAAITKKLVLLQTIIASSRSNDTANTGQAKAVQLDETLIATVRQLDLQAQEHLQRSLRTTRDRGRFFARLSQLISTVGCAGIFAIVLLSHLRIQRLGASRVRLNEELTAANEDLRQFVYSASHDLQEPLRVLMLYSDLIERNVRTQRPVANELGHLRSAAKQMSTLVFDLLSYTQVITGPKNSDSAADLQLAVEKAIASLRLAVDETRAQFSINPLPVVSMEGSHALLLLQNLFSNSLKYRRPDLPPHITVSAEHPPGKWVISVADNGIGVEPVYHQQIFGIFKRLHTRAAYPGTGLGLALCRRIVERYGGGIWVESELGHGSTFRFSVPDRVRNRSISVAP